MYLHHHLMNLRIRQNLYEFAIPSSEYRTGSQDAFWRVH